MPIFNSKMKNKPTPFVQEVAIVIYVLDTIVSNLGRDRTIGIFCDFIQSKQEMAGISYVQIGPNSFISSPLYLTYQWKINIHFGWYNIAK
jgi:hypothetical protein